jgi:Ser/Thr protein kinase RdoA (MazF antagonist)
MEGERILASGRDADIVDLGGGRVLRRPRQPRSLEAEAAMMRHARLAGCPVPEVFEVGPEGMVLERVDGPTMLDDLAAHPWRLGRHARTLAALHDALRRIPAAEWAHATYGRAAPDDVTVHGDLHPDNVLLTAAGAVLIDWSSAGRGPCGADAADAWLVLAVAAPPPGSLVERALVRLLRGRFLAAFLNAVDRQEAAAWLMVAAERRALDHNMTESEVAAMRRLAERHGTRPGPSPTLPP